jgi:hypothetical protein
LGSQGDDIVGTFEGFEQDAFVKSRRIAAEFRLCVIRKSVDDVASLIDVHDIPLKLFRQRCEVVSREKAFGASPKVKAFRC